MGEAFDRTGHFLGSADGATKREVFDKLNDQFKDAAEIRIRTIEGAIGSKAEMPRYRCHKEVRALKIAVIGYHGDSANGTTGGRITPADAGFAPFDVDAAYMLKHQPQVGGYYVLYDDGYASFSPAAAFESGYTRF